LRILLIYIFLQIIQFLRLILSIFIVTFLWWTKFYQKRALFEKLNRGDARSFSLSSEKAHLAFEVSSEGELEQVLPVIRHCLGQGQKIELVYASESVEKKCQELARTYPQLLRVMRLNLLTWPFCGEFSLNKWLTADTLVLCRYDFYPELLLYGLPKSRRFILVNATLKGKKKTLVNKLLIKNIYSLFNKVVWSTEYDVQRALGFNISVSHIVFDFRILQIFKRIENISLKWSEESAQRLILNKIEEANRPSIVFGSFWPTESKVFKCEKFIDDINSGKALVVVAPHNLDQKFLESVQNEIRTYAPNLRQYVISKKADNLEVESVFSQCRLNGGVIINLVPGMLCESFTNFDHAFVGGGHGRSIHSVLEPYIAGSQVYCGPKTYRSTEYDFVEKNSPQFIHIVEKLEEFYPSLKSLEGIEEDRKMRAALKDKAQQTFLDFVNDLN